MGDTDFLDWAKRLTKNVSASDLRRFTSTIGPEILRRHLAAEAPRRTGRLSRSFVETADNEVRSSVSYAFKVDAGGVIVSKRKPLLIKLDAAYKVGAPGYVTVAVNRQRRDSRGRFVAKSIAAVFRAGTKEAVALRRMRANPRARPYIAKAIAKWRDDLSYAVNAKVKEVFR